MVLQEEEESFEVQNSVASLIDPMEKVNDSGKETMHKCI